MSQCKHIFVNCGFTSITMACKHCGMLQSDLPATGTFKLDISSFSAKKLTVTVGSILTKPVFTTGAQTGRYQSAKPNESNLERTKEYAKFFGLYNVPIETVEIEKPSDEKLEAFNKLWEAASRDAPIVVSSILSGVAVANEAPDVGPAEFFTREYLESFYEPKDTD